jgi:hypothetical protein
MSATIVQRIRQVVAAEDDDFFNAETILYYANKAKKKVASYMVQREREAKSSLRALDGLRKTTNLYNLTSFGKGGYFQADIEFPSNLLEVMHLRYKDRTILRELTSSKLYMLEWGNLVPTVYEGYYYITNDAGRTFRLYVHENATPLTLGTLATEITNASTVTTIALSSLSVSLTAGDTIFIDNQGFQVSADVENSLSPVSVNVVPTTALATYAIATSVTKGGFVNLFYAAEPSALTLSSTELGDMPEHVENAVIYGAAVMMIGQESVRDPNGNSQIIAEVYKEELQSSAY